MSYELLLEPLRRVPLFQGLRPIQISEIARRAERVMFRAEDVIIREDQIGEAAFLIISGDVVRTSGPGSDSDASISAGTLLGEMAMLVETTYSSTMVCKGPVKALKITRESLHEQMQADLPLAEHLIAKLSGRLRALAEELRRVDQTLAADPIPAETVLPRLLKAPSVESGLLSQR
ncbi:cyclic nucleotide-binding domain-containing protein [Leptospira interrogans]